MTPSIVWKGPIPNQWKGRDGHQIEYVVSHIMQGTLASTDGWFHNANSDASSHYGVGLDGTIYQWVLEADTAWTNGPFNQPDMTVPIIAKYVNNGWNGNMGGVTIEHEGFTGNPMPEAQYQATLWLHKRIISTYGIPIDRNHLLGHYQFDNATRHDCPGKGFPWQRLISDLQAWQLDEIKKETTGTTSVNPHSNFTPNPNNYSVGNGVLTEMDARGDVAGTDEQFYSPSGGKAGLAQRSFTWAENGRLYIGFQQLNPDGTPSQDWEVQVWQKLP